MGLNRTSLSLIDAAISAGMTDADGNTAPPLAPGTVGVPAYIAIEGDRLVYSWDWTPPGPPHASLDAALAARQWAQEREPADLLWAFARIERDRDILAFVRKFGPLQLCSFGAPLGDLFESSREHLDHDHGQCRYEHNAGDHLSEPLSIWHRLSARVREMIDTAAELHGGKGDPAKADDLVRRINVWLGWWRATPQIAWSYPGEPVLRVGQGAAQHLVLQLAYLISKSAAGWAVCDGCSQPYARNERAPQAGRRNWCATCRTNGTMARLIKKAYRQRQGDTNR
jgi:hypothetical protein